MATSPSASGTLPALPTQFNTLVKTLERRSHARNQSVTSLSGTLSPLPDPTLDPAWRRKQAHSLADADLTRAFLEEIEADLGLAAEVGQALLKEKSELERRIASLEGANSGLLARLTGAVKETSQLQRRLEEAVSNLEQAESNNRALLFSLEDSRKSISRLTADNAKLVSTASQLKQLTRTHSDLKQELAAEGKRAAGAETKLRKQAERTTEIEERLTRAIKDLEELRNEKVLRSSRSHDALDQLKASLTAKSQASKSRDGALTPPLTEDNPEAQELLRIVEGLMTENDALRGESSDLRRLLEGAREEGAALKLELAHRDALADVDERSGVQQEDVSATSSKGSMPHSNRTMRLSHVSRPSTASVGGTSLLAEVMGSPAMSNSDYDSLAGHRPTSPASTAATSYRHHQRSKSSISRPLALSASTSTSTNVGGEDMVRALSADSLDSPSRYGPGGHYAPRTSWDTDEPQRPSYTPRRSIGSMSQIGALGLVSSGQKIPFGRAHSRRSMSVDVNQDRRDGSPSRPASVMSVNSSADDHSQPPLRPGRHHRPLSLSLGPSLFARAPESGFTASPTMDTFASRRQSYSGPPMSRRSSNTNTVSASASGETGLNTWIESPVKQRSSVTVGDDHRPPVFVDSETQTSPPPRLPPTAYDHHRPTLHSTPKQSNPSHSPLFSTFERTTSGTSHSEISLGSHSTDDGEDVLLGDHSRAGSIETRTAALSTLIEHAGKLLSRVQSADVGSQERRLKKQNLPGNVRHVAQANLKDLLHDIEGLRTYFRVLLEQERARAAHPAGSQLDQSLVVRKDFVSLVKLLRDLLYELSRMRALVNRVELDPNSAAGLRDLDESNVVDVITAKPGAGNTSGGLLAPLSRLFSSSSGSSLSSGSGGSDHDPNHLSPVTPRQAAVRPLPKREGSAAVSSATVNVEFGSGLGGRAVAHGVAAEDGTPSRGSSDAGGSPASRGAPARASPATVSAAQSETPPVRRDLSSIFAGGALPPKPDPWVVLPADAPGAVKMPILSKRASANPFGRLLSGFPTSFTNSLTTNAVLDSFQHPPSSQPEPETAPMPTLLERQLRPRGLSDSSIRSTFTTHGAIVNPHHRIVTKATLALSAELNNAMAQATPVGTPVSNGILGGNERVEGLKAQLTELSVSRKPSSTWLRPASSSRSNSPLPPSPLTPTFSISASPDPAAAGSTSPGSRPVPISPPRQRTDLSNRSSSGDVVSPAGSAAAAAGSMFSSLSSWAATKAGLGISTLAAAGADGEETPRVALPEGAVNSAEPATPTVPTAPTVSAPMTMPAAAVASAKSSIARSSSAERAAHRRSEILSTSLRAGTGRMA